MSQGTDSVLTSLAGSVGVKRKKEEYKDRLGSRVRYQRAEDRYHFKGAPQKLERRFTEVLEMRAARPQCGMVKEGFSGVPPICISANTGLWTTRNYSKKIDIILARVIAQ